MHTAPARSPDCRRRQDNRSLLRRKGAGRDRASGCAQRGTRRALPSFADIADVESAARADRDILTTRSSRDKLTAAAAAAKPAAIRIAIIGLVPPACPA